ncbi:MAG: transcriptional regulator [Firmicutes bacterium HGW-Firmicutes-12]|jgi:PAS domain S-box-containing protein|nr:MAG: transcriptional regulator [Firmicutes bacterium HGW-Firmicutes-12]
MNKKSIEKMVTTENIIQDLSQRIRESCLDQDLIDFMEELLYIFYHSSDGIYVVGGNGISLRVNPSFEALTGFQLEEFLNKNVRDLVKDGHFSTSVAAQVLDTKEPATIIQEYRNGNKALVTGTPIFDECGNVVKVISNIRDITELVNLYEEVTANRVLIKNYSNELKNIHQSVIEGIVAASPAMVRTIEMARRVAKTDSLVLLLGGSGVGKGVLAKFIYRNSERRNRPFVTINCGAIPESLLESELFGYAHGAFTGADKLGKVGLVEAAAGGVLFLDEIAEMHLSLQAKILDFVETHEYCKVGSTQRNKVDVRLIAATNRDLQAMVQEGRFREDLYYRLNVVPITISMLRDRKEDIPLLIYHYTEIINKKNKTAKYFTTNAIDYLKEYEWPGNVRELRNLIERMSVLAESNKIEVTDIKDERNLDKEENGSRKVQDNRSFNMRVAVYEEKIIKEVLEEAGSIRKAAKMLGMSPSSLHRKLKKQ